MELKLFSSPLTKRPAVGYTRDGIDWPILFIGEQGIARLSLPKHAPIAGDGYSKARFIKGFPPNNGISGALDGIKHQSFAWQACVFQLVESPIDHSFELYVRKGDALSWIIQIRPEGIYRYNIYWDWPFMTSDIHGNKKIAVLR